MNCDTDTDTDTLHRLLDRAAHLGPEYGAGMSSHLPMALSALHALGAPASRLQQFFDRSATRFAPPRAASTSAALTGDWRACRGRLDACDGLAMYFRTALAKEGTDAVLRRVLPDLMTGVGAAAFHGLIRSAYAIAANHPAELAGALAYWACRWLPLPTRAIERRDTPVQVPDRLAVASWTRSLVSTLMPRPEGRLITDRIQGVVETQAYAALAGRLVVDEGTLAQLAIFALDRYLVSRHFTVLHLVTSTHAMRLMRPWLDDAEAAIGHFADAYVAAYLSCGIAPDAQALPVPSLSWPEIVARAIESDDDHVIKLVHSCREEMTSHGNPAYLFAAALVVS